ncbi:MAG: ABC transporter ATP-binding protein [Deltaproteobacteria bacterium]|jgi:ATP-binding cassette subfamily B protein|nr:ABC transporter ATP-binding protein [Deltaproteobacteria bacterium]
MRLTQGEPKTGKGFDHSWQAARLVFPFFRQYRLRLIIGFLSLLAVNGLQLVIPRIIKHAVDGLQNVKVDQAGLLRYGIMIFGLALCIAVFRFGWRYMILGFSRHLEKDFRNWLFSHLLTLDRIFFQRKTTGEIMALATNDLAAVQLAGGMGLVAFADALVLSIAALSFMAYIHPLLTLIAIVPMPLLALLTRILSRRLHRYFRKVQEQFSRLTEFARTSINSITMIKAYTLEENQTHRFDSMGKEYVLDNLRLARVQGTLFPVSGLIANTSMLLVILFGGRLTIQGTISIGDFVAFTSYLFMLTWPMMALGWVTNLFQRGVTSLHRIQSILEERPVFAVPSSSEAVPEKINTITVACLSFSYQGQHEPTLQDISLQIRQGILGIVGKIGSGKTTLCHLLARLYPVADDTVFWNGIDVNTLELTEVRKKIALVPQDITVFSNTVKNNITMGNPDASMEEIVAVAKAAAIHAEIEALPQGYDTRIGEKGVKLSGGQRQRIALARALLSDRPVIIIDDGLSAVDIETEHEIINSIRPFTRGRICIIVSHRLAPLAQADHLIVMEKGKVVSQGEHKYLLRENKFYATIYEYQTSRERGQG